VLVRVTSVVKRVRYPYVIVLVFLITLLGIGYLGYKNYTGGNSSTVVATPQTPALISSLTNATTPDQVRSLLASGLTLDRYQLFSTSNQKTLSELSQKSGVTITQLPQPLFTTGSDIAQVAVTPSDNYIYAIDSTGQLWFWDGKQLNKITQATLITSPVSITALAKNTVIVSDSEGNLYLFDGSANQPIELTQPTTWASGTRYLSNYNGNLYVLTAGDGTVYRIPGFINTIANVTVVVNKTLLSGDSLLSFIIPGNINTLTTNTGLVDHPRSSPAVTLIMPSEISSTSSATFNSTSYEINNGALISTYSLSGVFQSAKAFITNSPISQVADYSALGLLAVSGSYVYEIK
jgi:hypothetical protein